jgi:nucleotide-binding universal stress UspA family protein
MSIFPTKVLLATDGSSEAQLAASTAADLADATNSELHVLSVARANPDPVYQIHEASPRYETDEQALEAIKGEAQKVLDEQVQKIREAGGLSKKPTSGSENPAIRPSSIWPTNRAPDS